MDEVSGAFAKLAGILKGVKLLLTFKPTVFDPHPRTVFHPKDAEHYFSGAEKNIGILRTRLPGLFGDFPEVDVSPSIEMADPRAPRHYDREQVERLQRVLEQAFELRSHSELERPVSQPPRQVFLTHGRATYWREVQSYIEKDLKIPTIELAQQPNEGRTVLQKLKDESDKCSFAVIVMSGDDTDSSGTLRARENVMHEIGYFQGKYGLHAVALLHEEGTNIPSNIQGVVYIPFAKENISATFGLLTRELNNFFKL